MKRGRVGNLDSESNPVKQKSHPNPRINLNLPKNRRISGKEAISWNTGLQRVGLKSNGIQKVLPGDGESHTFLFKNIPEMRYLDALVCKFNCVGEVTDICCPRKRDKEGIFFWVCQIF